MKKKIESLTPEQVARFPEFVKKWTEIGLSTQPANREKAEHGIEQAYAVAGLPKPKIVWCSSPLAQGLTRAIILKMKFDNGVIGNSVGASVLASVLDSVEDSVRDSVGTSVRSSVWNKVRSSVWDSVEHSVLASVEGSVRDSVWNNVLASVGASVEDSGYGQHDSGWISYYDYFKTVCSLDAETQKLCGITEITENAGWWLPHEKICWISERHNHLMRDERGRLHNYNGAALTYPDGWGIYSFHGVRVPEKYALTKAEDISVEDVLKESSAEVRMAVLGKIGLAKALGKIPHKVIDSKNGNDLIEFTIEDEPVRGLLLRWTDMYSSKSTVLPVPRTIEEFKESFCDDEYPEDFPDNVNDCEQVRISTFRGFIHQAKQEAKESGKHWMDCIEFVAET